MYDHNFGGWHTETKLKAVKDYITSYNIALQNQPFNRIYIDAFAGNGRRLASKSTPLLDDDDIVLPGSAKIALETNPGFHKYYFIDAKKKHHKELKNLCDEYPDKDTTCIYGDANQHLIEILKTIDEKKDRVVLFLDPYGAEVAWETLEAIANKPCIDVWYLFPMMALFRQATLDFKKIDDDKAETLTKLLGREDWLDLLYTKTETTDLFGNINENVKRLHVRELDRVVHQRLNSIFRYVETPLPLDIKNGAQGFSLFIALSNPSDNAISLAKRIARHILKSLQ